MATGVFWVTAATASGSNPALCIDSTRDGDDLDACHRFYRDVRSLELVRPPEEFTGDHAMFRAGDTGVTLPETGRGERWDEDGLDHDSITE